MANLLVDTHYKLPWIVWKREHAINVPLYGYDNSKFAHGLPFLPLIVGSWSTSSTFSPSYDLGLTTPNWGGAGQPEHYAAVTADSVNINFDIVNNSTTAQTYYFRLMAFAPPDYNGKITPVNYTWPFRYNSKYRYQKIYMAGKTNGEAVNHNLRYIPQVRVWPLANGAIIPNVTSSVTTTQLIAGSCYYHIYKDKM